MKVVVKVVVEEELMKPVAVEFVVVEVKEVMTAM